MNDSSLSLRNLEDLLHNNNKTQTLLEKNHQALLQYVEDIKNLRTIMLNDIGQAGDLPSLAAASGNTSQNRENILKKALKCKQLEDDNKKLRKLLKTQIENSE